MSCVRRKPSLPAIQRPAPARRRRWRRRGCRRASAIPITAPPRWSRLSSLTHASIVFAFGTNFSGGVAAKPVLPSSRSPSDVSVAPPWRVTFSAPTRVVEAAVEVPGGERRRGRPSEPSCARRGSRLAPASSIALESPGEPLDPPIRRVQLRVDLRQVALAAADAAEGRGEPVVFGLADRVELVVVAAGAVDGQAEEGLADRADEVLQLVAPDDGLHRLADLVLPDRSYAPATRKPVASIAPGSSGRSTSPASWRRANSS